jgi:urease accessory protein
MNPAWALLRLASPQLPIGGYSYSQGLEMAVDNGLIKTPDDARRWISDQMLLNLARFEAPLLLAHCTAAAANNWDALLGLCEQHRASRETRELYQESRQMGYSLQQLLAGLPELDSAARSFLEQRSEPHLALGWDDYVLKAMLEQLGATVESIEAPFQPEHGAYGGGHHHSRHGDEDFNYAPRLHQFGVRT